jgi:hypothetical protein
MPSNAPNRSDLPDFDSGFRFDEATLEALDRARELPPLTFEEYIHFLNALTAGKPGSREISGPDEPFTL